ncbi:hypothetical protein DL93DRAFT_2169168 [Clavulina sp. PMI_390]|nr:hypothetical protein DL93DRAFT_2169168 [Clavulina sp. PMI_390]
MVAKNKVIVRRLPPNLPEPIFWKSVSLWVTSDTVTWKSYHPGKLKSRPEKPNVTSRAYIAFKSPEQVVRFSKEYDGHLFRDKQGNESYAVVEFAPFQKVPADRKKQDARVGTINQDEDFKSFVESLSQAETVVPEAAAPKIDPKSTPLLEALKAEKAAAKDAAQILSYHGHYKAKGDRPGVKPTSKLSKAVVANSATTSRFDDEGGVFSRKLNADGSVPAPAVLKAAESPVASTSKPSNPSKGKGGRPAPETNAGDSVPASPSRKSAGGPKKKPTPAQQSTPQIKGNRAKPAPNTSATAATATTGESQATTRGDSAPTDPPSASGSSKPATNEASSSQPSQGPSGKPERRKHAPNPRMLQAALAGVGGGGAPRRREREASKSAEKPQPETSGEASAIAAAGPSDAQPAASSSTPGPEKKDRPAREAQPSGRGGRHRHPKGPKPTATENTDASTEPAQNTPASSGATPASTQDGTPSQPSGRGVRGGRRGGRGRGRGAGPNPGAPSAPAPASSES